MSSELRFDVLVLGGGGAALRAALSACEQGAKTAILSKGEAGKSGATYYSVAEVGAFNVPDGALDPEDSPEEFYRDMEMAALGTAQLPLCRILAEQAESALQYLEKISGGTVFAKEDGHFKVYQACFSTRPRSHVVENHFKPILRALREEVARRDITVLSGLQAVDLLKEDGQVCGVYALDEAGAPVIVHAGSVVLATGGASRLFRRNMYPRDITGDGYAMAWRAGARMSNMEFIQAGIGVAAPFINLFGNYLWEANPQIENAAGEPVLEKYLPAEVTPEAVIREKTHFPFSTRDLSRYIEIAVQSEYNYGRGTAGGNMLLNFRGTDFDSLFRRDPVFTSMWKVTYQWHKERGIDLYRDPVEIACFAHALNGGVLIDEHAAASLPGLYAAGETASGPHGADRLGGNMSVTCQVFGNIAGRSAAAYEGSPNWRGVGKRDRPAAGATDLRHQTGMQRPAGDPAGALGQSPDDYPQPDRTSKVPDGAGRSEGGDRPRRNGRVSGRTGTAGKSGRGRRTDRPGSAGAEGKPGQSLPGGLSRCRSGPCPSHYP